ncbi:MAG TPA: sigma 54-interacting transcriptional regulator [Planctomycetota bacterium]|nr:sigma 54-interacting transcriptional regulator [Planctomycetota bacterium]
MARAHLPIVDAFIEGDYSQVQKLANEAKPGDPYFTYYRAVAGGVELINTGLGAQQAYEYLRESLDPPPSDPELFYTLLRFSVDVMLRLGKVSEAQRSLRLLKEIDDPFIRRDLKLGAVEVNESAIYYFLGNFEKAQALLDEAMKLGIVPGTVTWFRLKVNRAVIATQNGNYTQAERDLADLAQHPLDNRFAISLRLVKARLCMQTGRFEDALALFRDVSNAPGYSHSRVRPFLIRTLLLAGRTEEAQTLLDQETALNTKTMSEMEYFSLRALQALVSQDLAATREHARKALAVAGQSNPFSLQSPLLLLAEAELISRKPDVARQILSTIEESEARRPTMMYWVRLYLLENNFARASQLFKTLVDFNNPELIQEGLRFASEVKPAELTRLWASASKTAQRTPERAAPKKQPGGAEEVFFVGSSPAIVEVKARIRKFASVDASVLITGETGTGKEVVARLLHQQSARASKPFVAVNCAAISDTLMESELFGHVKGAFTGAIHDHEGLFVAAGDGTLFLDEIEAMSSHMQAVLLRVLEEKEVRPLGSVKARKVNARVIVASNVALEKEIQARNFRSDLFYRLARLQVQLVPLRERLEDIPELVEYFLERIYGGARDVTVSRDLLRALMQHTWPGNVRELKNAVELITLLAGDLKVLTPDLFVPNLQFDAAQSQPKAPAAMSTVQHAVLEKPQPESAGKNVGTAQSQVPVPHGRYARERLAHLRQLFREQKKLTRAEVARLVGCAVETAQRDLEILESEGVIRRVCDTPSRRTSHFLHCEK